MYVFQTLVILLVYKTSFAENRWRFSQITLAGTAGIFFSSALGVWRQDLDFSLSKILYSFFAEPVFTWFSASTFLINNNIPLINFPVNFLTSFLNLMPNTFFNVRQYVVSVQDMGYITESPLGADSIWSNLIINFGSIGPYPFSPK